MANYTYKLGEDIHDAELFSPEGKAAYDYVAEVEAEILMLRKKVDILSAASKTFHEFIQENIDETSLLPEAEVEETTEE
tara:strand:+ start:1034 stop:1270 length:237 start_codon:yes stop_codon:yes gene_type:complete